MARKVADQRFEQVALLCQLFVEGRKACLGLCQGRFLRRDIGPRDLAECELMPQNC